jgi:hypothetical protein
MANRDFDPFASASHGPEAFNTEFLPPLAKAKLDEFFLQVSDLFSRRILFFTKCTSLCLFDKCFLTSVPPAVVISG